MLVVLGVMIRETMCTLVVVSGTVRDHGLVVAANRDESLQRPADPPAVQSSAAPGWVAPLDRQAGGTWIGVNRHGVFVGLVNRREPAPSEPLRSRGLVVRDALRRQSAAQIAGELDQLLAQRCSAFALVFGDARDLFLTVHGAARTRTTRLDRGAHVICSRDPSDPASRKVERIRAELSELDWEAPLAEWRGGLIRLLGRHSHAEDPLENTCVHRAGYGTRSSEILARSAAGWQWWHAEGPPCRTPFAEISHLWQHLQQSEERARVEQEHAMND
jgi:hypothetical protein